MDLNTSFLYSLHPSIQIREVETETGLANVRDIAKVEGGRSVLGLLRIRPHCL